MPTFEIAAPNGKKYRVEGPPGSTAAQALERIKKQVGAETPAAPTSADIPGPPGAQQRMAAQAPPAEDNALGNVFGAVVEPVATLGTGMIGTVAGSIAGAGKTLLGGKFGTQEGIREGDELAGRVAKALTYQPRTQTGGKAVEMAGKALAPLGGLATSELVALGRAGQSANTGLRGLASANEAALAVDDAAAAAGGGRLRDLIRRPGAAPGTRAGSVGAARTAEETLRTEQAGGLPVPLKLTRGMRSRDKSQLAFENIAAKDPETGAPLRNRTVELNQGILDNFDAFTDMTGAQGAPGLREAGKIVDKALINRVAKVKGEIRQAYDDAAAAGEMQSPAPYKALTDYLATKEAEIKTNNAPMLSAVEAKLAKLDPDGTGSIPLKEFEELRKMAGRLSPPGSTSSAFVGEIKDIIDAATEGQGGVKYQQARRMYENYRREFKDAAVIDKMLRVKPGTKDRAVALEDIVDHAILKAQSLDDVRKVRNTLTKAGEEGAQAWRELQAETMRQIKERVQTTAKNEAGAREVSPAALDKIVRELDADGRLEYVFTKKGAQQLRDLRDTVQDVKSVPAGTVSTSGTAEVVLAAMDTIASGMSGLPLPIGTAVNYGIKRAKKKKLVRRVDDALNPDGSQ